MTSNSVSFRVNRSSDVYCRQKARKYIEMTRSYLTKERGRGNKIDKENMYRSIVRKKEDRKKGGWT